MNSTDPAAALRSCGSCTMCCKVYEVPPVDNKPRGVWCRHCKPGRGCGIWESRPQFCRDFHCHWILDSSFGEEWKPEKSKLVMNHRPDSNTFVVMVDPGSSGAWLKEPYHSALRRLAANLSKRRQVVQIVVNHDTTILGHDRDFHLGAHADQMEFKWVQRAVGVFELADVTVKTLRVA